MPNLIACRPESFAPYADHAFELLPDLGITHVEVAAPPPAQLSALQETLSRHKLKASSVTMGARVQQPDFLEQVSQVVSAARALGAGVVFTSQKAGDTDRTQVYELLRRAGELAKAKDVFICLETHPDLGTNAEIMLQTMRGVNHPHVRINFDPANVHYYNQNVNALDEFRKVSDLVAAVHLKDTNGGYQAHHFPAIGEGVVDWKSIFAILNQRGFAGPFTLEMEGIAGEKLTLEETVDRIRRSMRYLQESGLTA